MPQRPQIILRVEQEAVGAMSLSRSVLLGRSDDCDICIRNDRLVSRHHCRLDLQGDQWEVVDLKSTNGIQVNGARASRHVLADGEVIHIGHVTIEYQRQGDDKSGAIIANGQQRPILTIDVSAVRGGTHPHFHAQDTHVGTSHSNVAAPISKPVIVPVMREVVIAPAANTVAKDSFKEPTKPATASNVASAAPEPVKKSAAPASSKPADAMVQQAMAWAAEYDKKKLQAYQQNSLKDRINRLHPAVILLLAIVVAFGMFAIAYYLTSTIM